MNTTNRRPRVVADRNIPLLDTLIGQSVDLINLAPDDITPEVMSTADAIITRTRTRCDAALLDGSPCRLVATATIGTDHIDFDYCHRRGIRVVSAPGCNAPAVAQYVWSSILRLTAGKRPEDVTVGIVGVGHVGSIVERWGRSMGYRVLLCDPPRADREGADAFVSLDRIARESDVITFHTPLTADGPYPTRHIADAAFLGSLARRPVIINSARGPVVDNRALVDALDRGLVSHAVIDCWEGEPAISPELLERATYATPHIAGYSADGKTRASIVVAHAVADTFGVACNDTIATPPPAPETMTAGRVLASYDPVADTERLKADPATFEQQRNHYHLRPEA